MAVGATLIEAADRDPSADDGHRCPLAVSATEHAGIAGLVLTKSGSMCYIGPKRSGARTAGTALTRPVPQTYHIECVATLER
jgi:hypothetical protein